MEAIRITDRLLDYINNCKGEVAQIHSVFDGAFNIIDSEGHLIGILSNGKDLSPNSMVVGSHTFSHKAIVQGNLCEINEGEIQFHNTKWKITLNCPDRINLSLDEIKKNPLVDLKAKLVRLKRLILEEGSLTGIAELINCINFDDEPTLVMSDRKLNEYSDFIKDRLIGLLCSISEKRVEIFNSAIEKTVGFGPGLTPSTDDFLTGIIVMMIVQDQPGTKVMLENVNELCAGKTTKISEEMIRHATNGFVPVSYKNFVDMMINDNEDNFVDAVKKVIQIGSSSGTDFLFGVYCMAMINTLKIKEA